MRHDKTNWYIVWCKQGASYTKYTRQKVLHTLEFSLFVSTHDTNVVQVV